jgi:Outer membrane protein beta-barrel domain
LRKFAAIACVCFLTVLASIARAQHVDLAGGASVLYSPSYTGSSQDFQPPAEKGGIYPSAGLTVFLTEHLGVNGEVSTRYGQDTYNGYQKFRPFLYDFNAVYERRVIPKAFAEFMAGVGGESVRFESPRGLCAYPACPTHLSDSHFLMHVSGGLRYYVWRNLFVRPEANYYRIVNNTLDFHSDNLLRLGASVGITFGPR